MWHPKTLGSRRLLLLSNGIPRMPASCVLSSVRGLVSCRSDAADGHYESSSSSCSSDGGSEDAGELIRHRRQVCKRCRKAAVLCICGMIKEVVNNRTRVSILQHPEERDHHLGSARIAVLALSNVEIRTVPEVTTGNSYRFRPKVQGSKRHNGGRGSADPKAFHLHDGEQHDCYFYGCATMDPWLPRSVPSWIEVSPKAALLFPSERAQDLQVLFPDIIFGSRSGADGLRFQPKNEEFVKEIPDQLIVLDGTWAKAKRLYMENPWLLQLPHYKLPATFRSMYSNVRSEPRAGCLSTLEGIVYALKAFEPETKGLDSLLDVFELMINHQQEYMVARKKISNSGSD